MVPILLLPPATPLTYQVSVPPGFGVSESWAEAEGATPAPEVMAKCWSRVMVNEPAEAPKVESPEYLAVMG
jgi:hypothetical protein